MMISPSFQLKGSLFTLSVLVLQSHDLEKLNTELTAKIELAPQFFDHAPIVIDLAQLEAQTGFDFVDLKALLEQHQLVPVGIRGAHPSIQPLAKDAGFAILGEAAKEKGLKEPETKSKTSTKKASDEKNKATPETFRLITQPIRSGQQIYAPGDLVVVNHVSPGAELLAEGNIHVYGRLQGRALAGVNGNTNARVFCHDLQAELVAIAGAYKVFEDRHDTQLGKAAQIYLQHDQLKIEPLV